MHLFPGEPVTTKSSKRKNFPTYTEIRLLAEFLCSHQHDRLLRLWPNIAGVLW
jgi:hypothetical protein